jgi:hypothetical protein
MGILAECRSDTFHFGCIQFPGVCKRITGPKGGVGGSTESDRRHLGGVSPPAPSLPKARKAELAGSKYFRWQKVPTRNSDLAS